MRIIDEMFAVWLARVEELVGCKVDAKYAREAFECHQYPIRSLSPQEYADEISGRR